MKTSLNVESINHHYKCESTFKSLASRCLLLARGLFTLVRKKLSSLPLAHAASDLRAGLAALHLAMTTLTTRRIFLGLGLMGVVAPLVSCFYMLFDRGAYDESWYYVNHFHLFLTLGPSLFLLSCLLGVWFLFPYRSARAYGLVVPAGFTLGKILWLIQCTSNQDFYSVVPASFILIGALVSVFIFIASDWLLHSVFHCEHAFDRREGTLYNGADLIEGEQFKGLFKKYVEEKRSYQKQY